MVESLLAAYSLVLSGMLFATWFFVFETRKAFKGGIFYNAWRLIATPMLFFMASQLLVAYEAIYGSTDAADAVSESFEALAILILLLGFYLFYKAWNPRSMA